MESFRLFCCAECSKQAQVCPKCDNGNRYCSRDCSYAARSRTQRAAARRYQRTPQGCTNHRLRQQRYRARLVLVTHQGPPDITQVPESSKSPIVRLQTGSSCGLSDLTRCLSCAKASNGRIRFGFIRRKATRKKRKRRSAGGTSALIVGV